MIVAGVPSVTYGAYLGMLFQRYNYGVLHPKIYKLLPPIKIAISKMVGRAMVAAFVGVPFGVPFLAIPNSANFAV